jgi:hypothetical protein
MSRLTPDASAAAAPAAPGSLLVTQVYATARPLASSGNPVRCGTTGRLEQAITEAVRARFKS